MGSMYPESMGVNGLCFRMGPHWHAQTSLLVNQRPGPASQSRLSVPSLQVVCVFTNDCQPLARLEGCSPLVACVGCSMAAHIIQSCQRWIVSGGSCWAGWVQAWGAQEDQRISSDSMFRNCTSLALDLFQASLMCRSVSVCTSVDSKPLNSVRIQLRGMGGLWPGPFPYERWKPVKTPRRLHHLIRLDISRKCMIQVQHNHAAPNPDSKAQVTLFESLWDST